MFNYVGPDAAWVCINKSNLHLLLTGHVYGRLTLKITMLYDAKFWCGETSGTRIKIAF